MSDSGSSSKPTLASLRAPVGSRVPPIQLNGGVVHLGREVPGVYDIQVAPDDTAVSRDHAMIYMRGTQWFLEDTSRNGTLVNADLIRGRAVPLRLGDRIRIGRSFDYVFVDNTATVESSLMDADSRNGNAGDPLEPVRGGASLPDAPNANGIWISPSAAVWRDGRALPEALSRTEYRLVKFLSNHPGEIVDYDTVVQAVWGSTRSKASLHELIFRVRRKLEDDAATPRYLIIRSGIGVVFFPGGEPTPV